MNKISPLKVIAKREVADLAHFSFSEIKSFLQLIVLLLVAFSAHASIEHFDLSTPIRITFQVIEYGALVIGSIEYLGKRIIEAWKNLKRSASQD